jgi:hypothetical protein
MENEIVLSNELDVIEDICPEVQAVIMNHVINNFNRDLNLWLEMIYIYQKFMMDFKTKPHITQKDCNDCNVKMMKVWVDLSHEFQYLKVKELNRMIDNIMCKQPPCLGR